MGWRKFWRRRDWDEIRSHEIDSYIEMETADNIARGMPPQQATEAARRKFGNPTSVREEIYRMNTVSWIESISQDLRHALRLLRTNPGFAFVAILSLTLGIGANTAIFQLLDSLRLRALPVKDPKELAAIRIVGGNYGIGVNGRYGELTRPIWEEIRHNHPMFSGVFAWSPGNALVGRNSDLQVVKSVGVSGEFFQVLGVEPWRGRLLGPEDEHACPENSAVVSYGYWQSRMGGRPIDASTKLVIDDQLKQIVGVTPPSFTGLSVGESFDIAMPFCQPKQLSRNVFDISVVGRLRPGATLESASAQLAAQSASIMAATEITGYNSDLVQRYRSFRLAAYSEATGVSYLREAYDESLWLLLAITGLVLLIACANLANLMLARASARERELAVRLAIGAGRTRLLRQLFTESALLACIGAVFGIAVATLLSRALVASLSTENNKVFLSTHMDWRVLLFTASIAVLTCLVFGIAPAFRASGTDPIAAMRSGGRGLTGNRDHFSMQRAMVVTQIAVSLVLLVGALLFVRSFRNLVTLDPGLREKGITLAFIGFQKSSVSPEHFQEFKRELLDDVRSIPGVINAASTTIVPLTGSRWTHGITIGSQEGDSQFTWVSPGYFKTMGIPLISGRDLTDNDTASSQHVVVVNQMFVDTYSKGINPIGRTVLTHQEPGYPATVYQIVGIIPNTKYACLRCGIPPMAFAPDTQLPSQRPWTAMMIYSDQPVSSVISAVKQRITEKHPEILAQPRSYETEIQEGVVAERLMAVLAGFFGILAAILGMVGLYGVVSFLVNRRRNEIGIRVALGADRRQVIGMIMREAALLLAIGVAIGTALSLAAGRSATALLFGLKSYDPVTLAAAIALLAVVGLVASLLPARRASKLDPMIALRCE